MHVRSEVGALDAVLVHRPDLELHRVTPATKDELLFDELVWVERAQQEHDEFTDAIRASGAETLYLEGLLAEVLADDGVRQGILATHVSEARSGRRIAHNARAMLAEMPPELLARHLIGGLTHTEAGETGGLVEALSGPEEFVLTPLANTVFMRDSSVWIGDGVVISPMNRVVRRRESDLLHWIYRHHPRFAGAEIWFGDEDGEHWPASVEGGDVLVVGDRAIAIGVTERTTPSGAAALATKLFEADVIDRVVVVELPVARSMMHLDTVLTMVDRDRLLVYPRLASIARTLRVTPGADGALVVDEGSSLAADFGWAAGVDRMETLVPPLDGFQADREQWNDGNNVFAVGPAHVIAYERNVLTNQVLTDAGVTVDEIPSYELSRGRGGPRCMTCPVQRKALPPQP
jgi:arginine deiminase